MQQKSMVMGPYVSAAEVRTAGLKTKWQRSVLWLSELTCQLKRWISKSWACKGQKVYIYIKKDVK